VIAAFERRDPDQARAAMAEHFTIGVAPLCEHLTTLGVIRPI
jgi:DNA-binding GntR family transcriptional regulator